MAFSYTGLAYLLGFFAIGLLTFRFFQYWRREKTTVSKIFFYLTASFTLFMMITAIAGLFFDKNTQALRWVVILAALVQSFGFAFIAYLIIYLKFPRISPWWGSVVIFLLGLITTFLTAITPFSPYLEAGGGVNWDVQHVQPLVDIFRFFLFLITFIPLIVILGQQIRTSENPFVKAKAFGMSLVLIFGILIGLLDFLLETILKLGAISSDITLGILSIIVFLLVSITQKPLPEEKYVPPPPFPKIPW